MIDHFRAKGPKFWWMVMNDISHVLDHRNLTKAQRACYELDAHAYCFIMDALTVEIFYRVDCKGTAHELWEAISCLYGDSSTCEDGKVKDDDPKEEEHECVEHDHNLVIVEDCSTLWSSDDDDDDRSTTSSLDKMDGDALSDTNVDSTSITLGDGDDDDGSSSGHDCVATTSPSTTPRCSMSQGDTKVSNANVVDHVDSYDELVSRRARMTMSLENEKAKTLKIKKTHF